MNAQPNDVAAVPLTLSQCRTGALGIIDNADFSWFHFKVCMVAGIGFFADAYVFIPIFIDSEASHLVVILILLRSYDIFAINIAWLMLGYVSGKGELLYLFVRPCSTKTQMEN